MTPEIVLATSNAGKLREVREILDGLSGHADVEDFRWWFGELAKAGGIGQVFLVHGEPESSRALAQVLDEFCDEEPILPQLGESFEV